MRSSMAGPSSETGAFTPLLIPGWRHQRGLILDWQPRTAPLRNRRLFDFGVRRASPLWFFVSEQAKAALHAALQKNLASREAAGAVALAADRLEQLAQALDR